MPSDPSPLDTTAGQPVVAPRAAAEVKVAYECYCGLGPACPLFRQMNSAQRAECSRDKRLSAQWMYMNGMNH